MQTPCYVTRDLSRHYSKQESEEQRREEIAAELRAEFMAAACMPLMATVSTPWPEQPSRRTPFLDRFYDELTCNKNRDLAARAVSVLMRSVEGREVVEALAKQHGEYYVDDAVVTE